VMTNKDKADPLERHERGSLTVWGKTFSAQAKGRPGEWELGVYLKHDAPRDVEGVVVLPVGDVGKLRALLDEMDLWTAQVGPARIECRRCGTSYVGAEGHHCQAIGLAE